ncbi:MAG: undecaprenyl-phosphate glucose phosphotransferase [Bradyrhizobium sp.]
MGTVQLEWANRPGNDSSDISIVGGPPRPLARTLPIELLRLYDMAVIGLAGLVAYLSYVAPPPDDLDRYPRSILLGVIVAAIMCQVFNVYSAAHVFSRWLGTKRVLIAWTTTFGVFLAVVFTLKIMHGYSRIWAVSWFASTSVLLVFGRLLLSRLTLVWAKHGRFAYRTLIVGVGESAHRLLDQLKARGSIRTQIVGFVDVGIEPPPGNDFHGYPVFGDLGQVIALLRQNAADEVIVAVPWSGEEKLYDVVTLLATAPVPIRLAPNLLGFRFPDRKFTIRAGLPMLKLFDRPISGWPYIVKLMEDQLLAVTVLVLAAPLLLLIAAAIKLDSPGPVFFKQKRFGFNDSVIQVWKLRSMRTECPGACAEVWTTRDDPRVTRVGRILRKSSIDELPQLINVVRGEMSVVGPRPHALGGKARGQLYQDVVNCYAARHKVKPGITGWAQVNGWRGETDTIEKIRKRVEYDMYYINNWSPWLDLYIIFKTVRAVFRAENAY